jgi:hypothetical protein
MADQVSFIDIESAVMDLLSDIGTCGTVTPSNLQTVLPFIRVMRLGGTDDRFTDTARIDIDMFESTRPLVWTLAETVRQRMLSYPHTTNDGTIDFVVTSSAPFEVPWGDPTNVRRFVATYTVATRR